MDEQRFDLLTRTIAASRSPRRQALALLGGFVTVSLSSRRALWLPRTNHPTAQPG